MSPRPLPGGLAVLKNRDFALFLAARFCSAIAAQMLIMAVGWQVYHLSGRVLDLGLVGLSQFLPFLCLVLFAGHAADQYDRRKIILLCLCGYGACAVLLLVFALVDLKSTWPIFTVLGVLGIARAYLLPTTQAFVPTLVPAAALRNALAVNSSAFQVATIVGPSVGGILYAFAATRSGHAEGADLVYGGAAMLLVAAIVLVALLRKRRAPVERSAPTFDSLLLGLRFILHRKTILGAITLDLFAVLFGGATALLPAFTRDVLHAGPEVFGYLRAAPGVGAGVTALWLAFRPVSRRVGVTLFTSVGVFGAATVVLGVTRVFWVAMVTLVVLGIADMISVFIRALLVQLETPDAIRGRVSAVSAVFIGASNELGEFESGFTAAWLGLVPAIIAGGAATLAVTFLWARVFFPVLWRMQTFEQLKDDKPHGA